MKSKTASATIYVQEELSDARLRCDELKNYLIRVLDLVNASDRKDDFYSVAGDVILAAPETLLKLERSLQAAAMAVNKLDYEEIRQIIRPEKVDELERVLENVRMRIPRRLSSIQAPVDLNDPDFLEHATAYMFDIKRREGLEATKLPDIVEMYSWDLGYQKRAMPKWLAHLGDLLGVDAIFEYKDGRSAKNGQE